MGNDAYIAVSNPKDFVKILTEASTVEIQKYIDEITSDREFHKLLEENQNNFSRRRFSSWGIGIGTRLGMVLYALRRKLKPNTVVETGVSQW